MAKYQLAIPGLRALEGGYVNDSRDRGGETFAGITRKFYPEWEGWKTIDAYKKNVQNYASAMLLSSELKVLVNDFYRVEFWDDLRLGEIKSQKVAEEILDASVNFGKRPATVIAQRGVNLLNKNGALWTDIKPDGVMGDKTIFRLNSASESALMKTLNGLQFIRYVMIVEADPEQEVWFNGWLNRVTY